MSNNVESPSLVELMDRLDLSSMSNTEIIRLRAEAARAEYICECVHSLISKIRSVFSNKKPAIAASVSHA
jgi:hypothetical protein